jgi:hypothetical protein
MNAARGGILSFAADAERARLDWRRELAMNSKRAFSQAFNFWSRCLKGTAHAFVCSDRYRNFH